MPVFFPVPANSRGALASGSHWLRYAALAPEPKNGTPRWSSSSRSASNNLSNSGRSFQHTQPCQSFVGNLRLDQRSTNVRDNELGCVWIPAGVAGTSTDTVCPDVLFLRDRQSRF
jgi:hypothetical protein